MKVCAHKGGAVVKTFGVFQYSERTIGQTTESSLLWNGITLMKRHCNSCANSCDPEPTRKWYRGNSGITTNGPCGVWCRGVTTCLLYSCRPLGDPLWNDSWCIRLARGSFFRNVYTHTHSIWYSILYSRGYQYHKTHISSDEKRLPYDGIRYNGSYRRPKLFLFVWNATHAIITCFFDIRKISPLIGFCDNHVYKSRNVDAETFI